MKKRLVSLAVAVALFGYASMANAASVTTNGDTNISIGGFIQEYFIWTNNGGGLGTIAYPKYTAPGQLNN